MQKKMIAKLMRHNTIRERRSVKRDKRDFANAFDDNMAAHLLTQSESFVFSCQFFDHRSFVSGEGNRFDTRSCKFMRKCEVTHKKPYQPVCAEVFQSLMSESQALIIPFFCSKDSPI